MAVLAKATYKEINKLDDNQRCANCGRTLWAGTSACSTNDAWLNSKLNYFCNKSCYKAFYDGGKSGASGGSSSSASEKVTSAAAAAGATVAVGAAKGMGQIIKWCCIIAIPLAVILLPFFVIKSFAFGNTYKGYDKNMAYEPKAVTKIVYHDNFDEKRQELKKGDYTVEDFRAEVVKRLEYKKDKDFDYVSQEVLNDAKKELGFKNADWKNEDKVKQLLKKVNATGVVYINATVKFKSGLLEAKNDSVYSYSFKDYVSGCDVSKEIGLYDISSKYIDMDAYRKASFVRKGLMTIFTGTAWNLNSGIETKIKYPNKKFAVSPYGADNEKPLKEKVFNKLNAGVAGLKFEMDGTVIVKGSDGNEYKGTYEITPENPTIKVLPKRRESIYSELQADYHIGDIDSHEYAKKADVFFTDGKVGVLTVKAGDKVLFNKVPVYSYSSDEFAILAGWTNKKSGRAQFLIFEK